MLKCNILRNIYDSPWSEARIAWRCEGFSVCVEREFSDKLVGWRKRKWFLGKKKIRASYPIPPYPLPRTSLPPRPLLCTSKNSYLPYVERKVIWLRRIHLTGSAFSVSFFLRETLSTVFEFGCVRGWSIRGDSDRFPHNLSMDLPRRTSRKSGAHRATRECDIVPHARRSTPVILPTRPNGHRRFRILGISLI